MYLANFDDYKYFSKDEFKCSHTGNCLMEKDFMDQLTILRQKVNRPFVITSGYRDPSHPIEAKRKILDNTLKVMLLIYYAMAFTLTKL